MNKAYYHATRLANWNTIGNLLAISGSMFIVCGVLVNNILLDHTFAMQLWVMGNPLLMTWAIGIIAKKWDDGLSIQAIAVMYLIAFVSGAYGLAVMTGKL